MRETTIPQQLDPATAKVLRQLNGSAFSLHLLMKLPAAFFMGVRINNCNLERCEVTVPFWWGSQNPFKSIYFAAQCSAAELSTGALAMAGLAGKGKFSMLIVESSSKYLKKASSKTTFVCEDGARIREAIDEAQQTGKGVTVQARSVGYISSGDIVSDMTFTWSFLYRATK